jgi:hypothetical protein
MPKQRTGSVKWNGTQWTARIRLNDGQRIPVKFPPTMNETDARRSARALSEQARRGELVYDPAVRTTASAGEDVEKYSERWLDARDAKGLASVRCDRTYLRTHVWPKFGTRSMKSITTDDMRALVEYLDDLVAADELSAKSALNIWGTTRKMFGDAAGSKRRELRILPASPCVGVEAPDRGIEKLMGYLYPVEFSPLVACPAVPLQIRRWDAVQTNLYLRPGELEVLECPDIDVRHWIAHVHRARDWATGVVKEVKTGRDRHVPIEPAVRPLIAAMHAEANGRGRLFPEFPYGPKPSDELRAHLKSAGVERAALFARDATRRPIRLYDLRATGITWMAVRGDDPAKIMRRAGHADFKTTLGYIREAENLRETFGTVFPPLPPELLGNASNGSAIGFAGVPPNSQGGEIPSDTVAEAAGFEPAQKRGDPGESVSFRQDERTERDGQVRESSSATHSATHSSNPRTALVEALTAAIRDGTAAGDLAVARVALDALQRLLGDTTPSASVVDLANERAERARKGTA